ncbi:MAG TPA: chemotaxis protein CheA, partial [Methylophaga aminisulfidivorans]|nr:chemotaxis protein CheA [Methylophaga aminisulfidivorans]
MSIDVSQFHSIFFEESFEGLDTMESGLLSMSEGETDADTINTIFRAAHSIKGGAGTFGFSNISEFTHGLETLLDQIRNGERDTTNEAVEVMLSAVDTLREMMSAVQDAADIDEEKVAHVSSELTRLLQSDEEAAEAQTISDETSSNETTLATEHQQAGWKIDSKPLPHLLQTGNEPSRMFNELAELGKLDVELDDAALPHFSDLDPEACYLSWQLRLETDASIEAVQEVFEWVEDDCELSISPLVDEQHQDTTQLEKPFQDTDASPSTAPIAEQAVSTQSPESTAPKVDSVKKKPSTPSTEMASIRVGTEKVDSLVNLVGELVITQSMLGQIGENFDIKMLPQLIDGLEQLERNTRELQENIMRIRMLPISFVFNRFPRLVHDMTSKLGKKVNLVLSGEQTELDKTVMEKIGDPLVHLVRNSLDHGLEIPEKRLAANKNEVGELHLTAYHQGGNIVIEISDDGAGLNEEKILQKAIEKGLVEADENLSPEKIHELIFLPGFSTADAVSDLSGRGVGMDVVRKNINSLGGNVEVISEPGVGSTFTIRLPLTLAIMDGQIIQVAEQRFIIPLISIIESVEIEPKKVKRVTGKGELYNIRDEYVPLIRLTNVFNLDGGVETLEDGLLVIVEAEDRKVGLFVDELLSQQQVVIKSLETNFRKVTGVACLLYTS